MVRIGEKAEGSHPGDLGRPGAGDLAVEASFRHYRAEKRCPGADEGGASADHRRGLVEADEARRHDDAVRQTHGLKVDRAVSGIDGGGDEPVSVKRQQGSEQGREGCDSDDGNAGGEPDRTRRRQADTKAGIAARTDCHRDPVEARKASIDPCDHALQEGQQRFRVTAGEERRLLGEQQVGLVGSDTGGTGIQRRIDG